VGYNQRKQKRLRISVAFIIVILGFMLIVSLENEKTLGQDGNPQDHPYIQLCVCDPETMTYIRLGGKVNFTDDTAVKE
jgi:uncharacterized pyridoxamine 5'-phosphate oxidase family protein